MRKALPYIVAALVLLVLGLLIGPCVLAPNPPAAPDEPAAADSTG